MLFNYPLLAIDIGSSAIKLVELKGQNDKKLLNIGIESLPPGCIVDGTIVDSPAVQTALRQLLRRQHIAPRWRRAAMSLGGSSAIIKKCSFPNVADEDELADLIEAEANQHFQVDTADLYYRWHTLEPAPESVARTVILVGVKKEIVDAHMAVIKSCGIKIGVVDCDVFAQANMLEHNFNRIDGLVALVNIGAATTQVSLIGDGQFLYTREVAVGAELYSREIAASMGVSEVEAERLKIETGDKGAASSAELQALFAKLNSQFVSEIQTAIDFFFQNGEAPPGLESAHTVFITGGGSRLFGIDAAFTSTLKIPVNLVNPLQRIAIPPKFSRANLLADSHLYGVAIGLGMRAWEDS